MSSRTSEDYPEFRYEEDSILSELRDYIKTTYGQHYVAKGIQTQDFLDSLGLASPFLQGAGVKYLARYGKKKGFNRQDLLKAAHCVILLMYFNRENETNEEEQS